VIALRTIRRVRLDAAGRALVWGPGLSLLSQADVVVALAPWLGVLRGPLGAVLAALGVFVWASRWLPARPAWPSLPGSRRRTSLVLFAAAWSVYACVGLHYASRLQVSGDEPHYLLMAQSLWRDADLDLENNFAREDWQEYMPGRPSPHYGAPRRDGRPFPAHSPGLPLLLAPIYALGGRRACVLLLAALASLLALQVRALAQRASGDARSALLAWAAAAGPPAFFYAFHVYTEVPSALALALALSLLLGGPGVKGAAGAALACAALPWLHVKMVPAAATLGLVALIRLRGTALAVFGTVALVMAAGYGAYYQAIFGHPTPLALYGGIPEDARSAPWRAAAGLLLDRSFGLLPHAPIFLLALAGLGATARRLHPGAWAHLLVGAAVVLPVLGWRMWWGGQCPPGRFLVPLLPFLGVALACRVASSGRGLARWSAAQLATGLALAVFMVWDPARRLLLNRGGRPTRVWDALSADTPVGRYLPSLPWPDPAEARVAAAWIVALLALLVLDRLAGRREGVDRLFQGLGLPVALLCGVGAAVDLWARAQ
jgi:hypothetical protein